MAVFEGTIRDFGWGYIGTDQKGFEWYFHPDENDPMYPIGTRSGDVFKTELAAIRAGKKWLKECHRSGSITTIKATPRHFDY